jgi:hypothetical protein
MLRIFERRMLKKIYRSIKENNTWRLRYNHELRQLYNEPGIMKVIKPGRLRWMGHLFRLQEQNPCGKLILCKPEGTRQVGIPAIRWLDSIEEDLKIMGIRNWRQKTQDQDQWRAVVEEAKIHCRL